METPVFWDGHIMKIDKDIKLLENMPNSKIKISKVNGNDDICEFYLNGVKCKEEYTEQKSIYTIYYNNDKTIKIDLNTVDEFKNYDNVYLANGNIEDGNTLRLIFTSYTGETSVCEKEK